MPKEKKPRFELKGVDEFFTTQEMRDEAKLAKIHEIPIEEIDVFPDHPYKVKDDEDMMNLMESIRDNGVLTPATVRKKDDGRYEMLSGHRRKRACELLGKEVGESREQIRRYIRLTELIPEILELVNEGIYIRC